jgi:hypothetical protein
VKQYCPCNGTEGQLFQDEFCCKCQEDADYDEETFDGGCDILFRALSCPPDDPEFPDEWTQEDDGSDRQCTAFSPPDEQEKA